MDGFFCVIADVSQFHRSRLIDEWGGF